MSYKLEKPYTEKQRLDFIVEYNHNQLLKIEETDTALYALAPNEIMQEEEPIINPNYETEQAQKEKERIGNLTMTKRVFALLLKEYNITYAQLKELIATNDDAQLEWDLCIELERKNPLLDVMGAKLGVTPEQLDEMFKYANGELTELSISVNNSSEDVNNPEPTEDGNTDNETVSEDEM